VKVLAEDVLGKVLDQRLVEQIGLDQLLTESRLMVAEI
jgi:hypothetical protein